MEIRGEIFGEIAWSGFLRHNKASQKLKQWSYSTARKYSKPYLRTLGTDPRDTSPYVKISFDWAL